MRSPRIRRPTPAPKAQGGMPIAAFSEASEASMEVPSALTAANGHLDALRALQAALKPQEFWSPKVLGQIPEAAVEAFVDEMVASKPAQRQRLAQARESRILPTTDRIIAMTQVLRGVTKSHPLHWAISWAAGLPSGVIGKLDPDREVLLLVKSIITWLPAGLKLNGLNVSGCPLEELPADLQVMRLEVPSCRSLKVLPPGMGANFIYARESGLESLPPGLEVPGALIVSGCRDLKAIPGGVKVGGLDAYGSGLTSIAEDLEVNVLDVGKCMDLRRLPDGLRCGRINAAGSGLEALPARLQVGRLDLRGCSISTLPGDLQVSGEIHLNDTPLARLSEAEIRIMAPGVTGAICR